MENNSNIGIAAGGWYDLNFDKLVVLLLPIAWRRPKTIAFLRSIAAPLQKLHYEFIQSRVRNIYRVEHNWQKCYLQDVLNEAFDPQLRRITIDESIVYSANYIYTSAERKPKFLGTMYLRQSSEYESNFDFIVNMNHARANLYDIRALVDFYKLFGTRYKIINNEQITMQHG